MSDKILFEVGQPVGICNFTSLPLLKISQVENTMFYDDKRFIVGRLLGTEESSIIRGNEQRYLLVVTISGFILSVKKEDIHLEPSSKMDAFLKGHEESYFSQRLEPYNGKLVKREDELWYVKL